ncbi:NUDIX domain-containing protein [Massiliimalia timonensis]|uniref:NUDIX domain-containing protein n=1 Tax=Massiliimalia timonensis TaxID=1987501 RepID=UPI002D2196D2|nr:NUDIX domain-containing protein [Massiliimalia timonensis]
MIRTTVIKGRIDIMLEVRFYDTVDDQLLKFAVIVSRYKGKWVFCKHKKRDTYECPGGHRENGEQIIDAAKRELWEETGAEIFDLQPVCLFCI